MTKFNVDDAEGLVLDVMVAIAFGQIEQTFKFPSGAESKRLVYCNAKGRSCKFKNAVEIFDFSNSDAFSPSTDWAYGGYVLEIDKTEFTREGEGFRAHESVRFNCLEGAYGPTHLIAAMRAAVKSRLGNSVEIPDEL